MEGLTLLCPKLDIGMSEHIYEDIFARWVSAVQWHSGTRQRAAVAVCRTERGIGFEEVVSEASSFSSAAAMYSGRLIVLVKKGWFWVMNSCAFVYVLMPWRRRRETYSGRLRDLRIGVLCLVYKC